MTSALSFAVLQDESSWGVVDGAAIDRYLPLTHFGLEAQVETRAQKPACGVLQSRHLEKMRRTIRGNIACPLYGMFASGASDSFARYIMRWAFENPEAQERESQSLHWFHTLGGSWWKGLRVTEATLSGSSGGVSLSIGVMGHSEAESALTPTLPANRGKLSEALFSDVSLTIGGVSVSIDSFQWSARYESSLLFNNDYVPSSLRTLGVIHSFTVKPLKTSDAYLIAQRMRTNVDKTALLTILARHEGTGASGTNTRGRFTFNKLRLESRSDAISLEDYIFEPLVFRCLKPQSSSEAIQHAWDLV